MEPDYPRTYRLSPSPGFAFGAMLLMYAATMLLLGVRFGAHLFPAMWLGALLTGSLGVWIIGNAATSKVVLTADAIERHGLFKVQRLARADIVGLRTIPLFRYQTQTQLVSGRAGVSNLNLPLSSAESDSLFHDWVGTLPDLDARDLRASAAAVEADPALGQTAEARKTRVVSTRKAVAQFYAVNLIAGLWIYLAPQADLPAIMALLLVPWLVTVLLAKSSHLCRLDFEGNRTDVRPDLGLNIVMPGWILMMCAMYDVGTLDWQPALVAGAIITAVLSGAVLSSDVGRRARSAAALALCVFSLPYGYGAAVFLDSGLDFGPHEHYKVAVLGRHGHSGYRTPSYYLTLAPWGPRRRAGDVEVREALYERMRRGSTACVEAGAGALGFSWYVVSACE